MREPGTSKLSLCETIYKTI